MSARVRDTDRGAKALLRRLAQKTELTVGVHEAEGAQEKDGGDGSLIDIAVVHEFGYEEGGIPRRSFVRDWADENAARHREEERRVGKAVIAGKLDAETGMKRLGVLRQAEVQKRISDGIAPELKKATVDRKGSSTPLIETGQLRSAVTHEVKVTG